MTVLLIGLNHKTTPVELRERLFLEVDQRGALLTDLLRTVRVITEAAVLSTCNRLEVYAEVDDIVGAEREIVRQLCAVCRIDESTLRLHLYIMQERRAVQHLLHVASGLDSMILGEPQILGQVAQAFEDAHSVQTTGAVIGRLFSQAIHTGKRARTETAISQHTMSVSHAAALLAKEQTHDETAKVLIVGAGEMAELAVAAMHQHGFGQIGVINRTFAHAQQLAETVDGVAYEWSRLWDVMAVVDVVITATGAPHTIFYPEDVRRVIDQRGQKALIFIDVAVPRDVDASVRQVTGARVYDIDDLQRVVDANLAQRKACIPDVSAIIDDEEARFTEWLASRDVVPVIADLRQKIHDVAQNEVDHALNRLDHLSDADKAVIQQLAHRIVNKVLHHPTVSLKEHAAQGDAADFSQVVRELFALNVRVPAHDD